MDSDKVAEVVDQFAAMYRPLITVEEACEIAQVPPGTLYSWSAAGQLDELKVKRGRRVLFPRDEFVRFVLNGRRK